MAKSKEQRQREAAWRQARLELLRDYNGPTDERLEEELRHAQRGNRHWEVFSLEKRQRQRSEWMATFLSADASWLQTALHGKDIPAALQPLISGPLREKGLDHLLPAASPSRAAKPRF